MTAPAAKHFLNNPASLVLDSLQGLCALNPQVTLDSQNKSEPIIEHLTRQSIKILVSPVCR